MADKNTPSIEEHEALKKQVAALTARLESLPAQAAAPLAPAQPNGTHDLHTFTEGEYTHRATKAKFKLKVDPDDAHGRQFKLKNETHTFEVSTLAELREHFDGDFSRFEPKPPEKPKG